MGPPGVLEHSTGLLELPVLQVMVTAGVQLVRTLFWTYTLVVRGPQPLPEGYWLDTTRRLKPTAPSLTLGQVTVVGKSTYDTVPSVGVKEQLPAWGR